MPRRLSSHVVRALLSALLLLVLSSCTHRRRIDAAAPAGARRVQGGWVDLVPMMELRIENAYYRDGVPKHGLEGYLGTETAHYQVRERRGLRLVAVQSVVAQQPHDQLPVQELIFASQRGFHNYRFYYAVVFNKRGNIHGSVLLGAGSEEEIDRLHEELMADPDSVCGAASTNCTVFPEMCTVSIEIEIVVNGAPRTVASGSPLSLVAPNAMHVELKRSVAGKLTPVKVDLGAPAGLRIGLFPGDQIKWDADK